MSSTQAQENKDILELIIINLIAIYVSFSHYESGLLYISILNGLLAFNDNRRYAEHLLNAIYRKLNANPSNSDTSNNALLRSLRELVQQCRNNPNHQSSDISFDDAPSHNLSKQQILRDLSELEHLGVSDYANNLERQIMVGCGITCGLRRQILVIGGHSLVQSAWLICDRNQRFPPPPPGLSSQFNQLRTFVTEQRTNIWTRLDILGNQINQILSLIVDPTSEEHHSDEGQHMDIGSAAELLTEQPDEVD
ncbi:hypothetical protein FANTH_5635 [Fusarium anthophilum]|uniref:Uncharacterized protein n=1 Tax=Fusarium anthophilum TaxID=48485 RepID=A0A8H4ZLK4_9HYPO|nr:hypothetical protein FANTH_5635 [Fusarium anthophilum]